MKARLEELLNKPVSTLKPIGGGCIAQAQLAICEDGEKYFIKHSAPMSFTTEGNGLSELQKSGAIRVPKVIAQEESLLILEHIEGGTPDSSFFSRFGRQFATLHRYSSDTFGFRENNYIGSTPQVNLPATNQWPRFYFENRLLYQLKLAKRNGYATSELTQAVETIGSKIDQILEGSLEAPSLLHGDLWSGNFLCDQDNNPVLIDPAVYYGHREADLAMTKLFGGFSPEFYRAYNEEYPLAKGYEGREGIYKLYHMLNHLNLFGRSYYSSSLSLALQYSE